MGTRSKAQIMEDKFLNLRSAHDDLKAKSNSQEETIIKLGTKLAMIEETLRRKRDGTSEDHKSIPSGGKKKLDKDTEDLISSLRRQNNKLKQEKLQLSEELRNAREQLRRRPATGGRPGSSNMSRRASLGSVRSNSSGNMLKFEGDRELLTTLEGLVIGNENNGGRFNSRHQEVLYAVKARLQSFQEKVQSLQNQNIALREQQKQRNPKHQNNNVNSAGKISSSADDSDQITLQRELRDKSAQITILRGRYEHLEAKARAAAEIHERTVHLLEESNRNIRDLRRKIQALQHENETLVVYQHRAEETEQEMQNLKDESRLLEERMTALCESPFINDAFEARRRVEKLLSLEQQDRQQRLQIEHLKETAKMHHAEILTLKNTIEQLSEQREKLIQENDTLKIRTGELERGSNILEEKVMLYTGEGDVDPSDLQKALTMVKRKTENPSKVDFLEHLDDTLGSGQSLPALKRKMQELQIVHLSTTRDLERSERMLKAQANINRDLNAEVRELSEKLKGEQSELLRKLDDYETLAAKRLHKIHALEAQVKQLLHQQKRLTWNKQARDSGASASPGLDGAIQLPIGGGRHASLQNGDGDDVSVLSLSPSDADFGPGENLVEVWVLGAKLIPEKVDAGATTFLMVDFFDFETQTSPLLTGINPSYNFAATYKIEVDHFFIRYLATERLVLEFNRTRHTNYELLGNASISMRPLLEGEGRMSIEDAEIISALDGSVLGTLRIKIRLALPIRELYDLYLREHPEEKERMRLLKQADLDEAEGAAARARAQNQLEISIKSCTALGNSKDRESPSPYVHYQLLSFADTFTPSIRSSADPVFNHTLPFPLNVDRKLLRFLKKEKLALNVFDENKREGDMDDHDGEGLLGVAKVSLAPLAQGKAITGSFPLVDNDGRPNGGISVRIAWKSPLSLADVGGPMALSSEQLNAIFKRFDRDNDGQVAWKPFLSEFALPDQRRFGLQTRMRQVISRAKERKVDYVAVLNEFDKDMDGRLTVSEIERALKQLNMNMSQDEGLLLHTYLADNENKITMESLLQFVEPPDHILLTAERKVRGAFAELDARGQDVESCFSQRNYGGRVSHKDFKLALVELGFILLEEERVEYLDPRDQPDWNDHEQEKGEAADERASVGEDHTKIDPPADEEEILENNSPSTENGNDLLSKRAKQMELDFHRRKQEFEERMERARSATVAAVDVEQYDDNSRASAVKLQTNFRGYRARKAIREGKIESLIIPGTGAQRGESLVALPLVEAEEALRKALAEAAVRSPNNREPDLHKLFVAIDKERVGVMSIRDFERVMAESELNLSAHHVAALASAFTNADGKVEWAELINFLAFKPRDVAQVADQLRNAILRVTTPEAFRVFDQNSDGVISSREFRQGLKAMDIDIAEEDVTALLDVFDTDGMGEIQYQQFVAFAQQQEIALELKKTESKLRNLVQQRLAQGIDLATSFRHFDRNKDGVISRKEFRRVLRELGFDLHDRELKTLFARFDPFDHGEIGYEEFVSMMKAENKGSTEPEGVTLPPPKVDLLDVQKRCMNVVRKAARNGHGVLYAFEHYDWKTRGIVSEDEFQASLLKAGFFLSLDECKALRDKFQSPENERWVKYRDFVRWCTPDVAHVNSVVEKLRYLINQSAKRAEGKLVDFRPAFRVFDVDGTGEVSRRNFKDGLSTLNWDLTDEEVRSVMEYFDQNRDGFIDYEEFVTFLTSGSTSDGIDRPQAIAHSRVDALVRIAKCIENRMPPGSTHIDEFLKPLHQFESIGRAPINDFESALIDMGAGGLSAGDMRQLVESFAVEKKQGFVDIRAFQAALKKCILLPESSSTRKHISKSGESVPLDQAISELRECLSRAAIKGVDHRQAFEKYDEDYSGHITEIEFQESLSFLNFNLRESSMRTLLAQFAVPSSHHPKVSYRAILRNALPQAEIDRMHDLSERVNEKLKNRAKVGGSQQARLKMFKRTKRGGVSRLAFKNGIELLDIELEDYEIRILMDELDAEESGEISYEKLCQFLDGEIVLKPKGYELNGSSAQLPVAHKTDTSQSPLALFQRICSQVVSRGFNLRTPFEKFDSNFSGLISTEKFLIALEEIGFDLNTKSLRSFVAKFDQEGTGKVDYLNFIHTMHPRPLVQNESEKVWRLEETLRLRIRQRELETGSLKSPFIHFAGKRRQDFKLRDLGRGMAEIGLQCSKADAISLFSLLDLNSDGVCTFDEFAVFVRDPDYRDVEHRIRSTLACRGGGWPESVSSVERVFHKADRDESGKINLDQLEKVMKRLGLTTSQNEHRRIMNRYDDGGDERMPYKHFLSFLEEGSRIAVSASRAMSSMKRKLGPAMKLTTAFERLDNQHCGSVSRQSFVAAIDTLAPSSIPDNDLKAIMDCFDHDSSDLVHYYDFALALQGDPSVFMDSREAQETISSAPRNSTRSTASDLKHRVRRVLSRSIRNGFSVRKAFEKFDRNASGRISKEEFHNGLISLGYTASEDELEALMSELDQDGSGGIEYLEFVHFVHPKQASQQANESPDVEAPDVWRLEEELRTRVRKREMETGDLRSPFIHFAGKSRTGFKLRDLGRGMSEIGMDCSKTDAETLFAHMDLNADGEITYEEFAVFVRDPDYRDVEHRIQAAILGRQGRWKDSVSSMKRLFQKVDRDGSGTISASELKKVLHRAGLPISKEEVQRVVNRYDVGGTGEMSWKEFQKFLDETSQQAREVGEVLNDIRDALRESGKSGKGLQRVFEKFDVNNNGQLSKMEFASGLNELGFRPIDDDLRRLMQCFDFDGDGSVSYEEFSDFIQGNVRAIDALDPEVETLLVDLRTMLQKEKKNGFDFRKSFERFDANYSGAISIDEFANGLEDLGFNVPESLSHKLFDRFAVKDSERIDYRSFLELLLPMSVVEVEMIATKLRRLFEKESDGSSWFEHFRPNRKGMISRIGLSEGLEELGFELSDSELRLLMDQFDVNRDGLISTREFEAFVRSNNSLGTSPTLSKSPRSESDNGDSQGESDVDELEDDLRALVLDARQNGISVRESFEHFDSEYTGEITQDDLKRGLRKLKFNINESQVRALIRRFAGKGKRVIRLADFFRAILPDGAEHVEKVVEKFRKLLARTDLERSFRHFERDRDGNINRVGFKRGMDALQFKLTDSEVRMVMDVLDQNGDSKISFDEFADFAEAKNDFAPGGARSLEKLRKAAGSRQRRRNKAKLQEGEGDEDIAVRGEPGSRHEKKNSVTINMEKIKFSRQGMGEIGQSRRFMVSYSFMNSHQQTEIITLSRGKESAPLEFSMHFPMSKGSVVRKKLQHAMEKEDSARTSIVFRLMRIRSTGKSVCVGTGEIDLLDIYDDGEEFEHKSVRIFSSTDQDHDSDERSSLVAKLSCTVRALDLLKQFRL